MKRKFLFFFEPLINPYMFCNQKTELKALEVPQQIWTAKFINRTDYHDAIQINDILKWQNSAKTIFWRIFYPIKFKKVNLIIMGRIICVSNWNAWPCIHNKFMRTETCPRYAMTSWTKLLVCTTIICSALTK